jgi:indole-3-acetate monooxygenase
MTHSQPPSEVSSLQLLLTALEELTPLARARAGEADRMAKLSQPVSAALAQHGLFRLWIPRRHAGFELSLPEALRVYEAAARVDGSVGWAVMIGSGGGLFAAYLSVDTAQAIYAPAGAVIAGSGAPDGCAEQVDGGYRVSGRWRYASGAGYATAFTANCLVTQSGAQVRAADGSPLIRAMAFDASQVRVHASWDTAGMRGTGSDDFEVQDVFVPSERSFSVFTDEPREAGVLYRLPFGVLTELPVAAVALGIARHALETFEALARSRKGHGSARFLADDAVVQIRFAESCASWQLAKAGLRSLAEYAWQVAQKGRALSASELAEITAGCALAVDRLQADVGRLIAVSGMTGIQAADELARAWRDLQAVAAHAAVSPRHLREAGANLLTRPVAGA